MTSTPDAPNATPQTRTTGARLRAQRQARGWTLDSAEEASGVKAAHLVAIERGRPDMLPASGYALGYVRAYARALGLDADALVADYKRELQGRPLARASQGPRIFDAGSRRLPRGMIPALAVVGAVVMLGAWYGVQLDTAAAPDPGAVTQIEPGGTESQAPIPDSVVTLRTTAPSWIRIRDEQGRLVVNRVFVTDEQWQAARGEAFTVSVRDGGAVELLVGERSLGPLGRRGEPVENYVLGAVQ